jgi:LacI family transcriptional regulator
MKRRITIKDIAERTGVSIGTIDRVLHNRGHVSAQVREQVLSAMREMGYEPNIMARTLATNRLLRVLALLPDYRQDPYWEQPKEGVERAAEAVGHYGLRVEFRYFALFDPADFEAKAAAALAEAPDALLFAPLFLKESEQLLGETHARGIPTVMINTNLANAPALAYIGQDSYQSGVLAGRLLDFGLNDGDHAMVLNLDKAVTNARHLMDKERGFKEYFKGVRDKNIVVHAAAFENFDEPGALPAWLDAQFAAYPALRGFFVTNSRAYVLVRALAQKALKKVKIVGFDLIEPNLQLLAAGKIPFLINQNARQQGYLGVATLVNHLIMKKDIRREQFLPLDVIVKENVEYYLQSNVEIPLAAV